MDIDKLNAQYGAPGRIVFRRGLGGFPEVVIANKYGTAEIALLGANVLSYRPTGHSPVVFRPAKRDYNRGESVHGGIPVCWPQFGRRFSAALPQHGFARLMAFEVRASEYSDESTEVTLGLRANGETRALWPHDFDLEYRVSVTMKLNLTLTTRNVGTEPFDFSCGLHPYFVVRERDRVTVEGLDGLGYVDGLSPDLAHHVQSGPLRLDVAPDSVYEHLDERRHEAAILDPGLDRAIALATLGNTKTVVWNVGDGKLPDLAPEDAHRYVCVEPVSDWPLGRTLPPGGEYVLTAAIQSTAKPAEGEA